MRFRVRLPSPQITSSQLGGGEFLGSVVEDPENISPEGLTSRERVRQERLDKFWEFWRVDYLRSLPASVSKQRPRGSLEVGSVVLIHEDNVPRLQWALGRVAKLYPGKDGKVRSVELQTSKGSITRSVQRLHLLELVSQGQEHCLSELDPKTTEGSNVPTVSRWGRTVKPVQRWNYNVVK